ERNDLRPGWRFCEGKSPCVVQLSAVVWKHLTAEDNHPHAHGIENRGVVSAPSRGLACDLQTRPPRFPGERKSPNIVQELRGSRATTDNHALPDRVVDCRRTASRLGRLSGGRKQRPRSR